MSEIPITIRVKIAKMGNSVRMTIPKAILETLGWTSGDYVRIGVTDGEMIVKKEVKNE